ncbi:MAG: hypothetical protein JW940_10865 [Polyangiaceae bacterium]|nr:hypothetical protein [Polyangiaceae bacterium]
MCAADARETGEADGDAARTTQRRVCASPPRDDAPVSGPSSASVNDEDTRLDAPIGWLHQNPSAS